MRLFFRTLVAVAYLLAANPSPAGFLINPYAVAAAGAFPTVAATSDAATSSSTSHTITLPSGIVSGGLVMCFITARFASSPKTAGWTWTAGWTELEDEAYDTTANSAHMGVVYRLTDGTEGSTITATSAGTSEGAYSCYRITGNHASSAPEKGTATTHSGGTSDPPNLTPSWGAADTLWIVLNSRNTAGGSTLTSYPTSYTDNQINRASATLVRTSVANRPLNATSENPGTWGFSSGQFDVSNTFAVRPQ